MTSFLSSVNSIHRLLSEICVAGDRQYAWENPRRFSSYAKRLQLVVNQLLRLYSPPENVPPSVQTSVRGIAGDLGEAVETLTVYKKRSQIFVLINCQALCASLQERTIAIGGWLALLDSVLTNDVSDIRKKIAELSADMKQAQFRVTENEERVHYTLAKEGQGRQSSKVVQSAIVMDLARALGIGFNDQAGLSKQVKLLQDDLVDSDSLPERQILMSLQTIVDNWSIEPDILTNNLDLYFEDDAHISPFKNFLCPLTKEVMKDPVVLVSSQSYERTAITFWLERCLEDGREPTCPVTGEVLSSLELKPNIGLAGIIEEWVNRNIEICIKSAVQCLKEDPPSMDGVERALDDTYKISEEHPASRYKVRSEIVPLIVKVFKECSKNIQSHLRCKFFMALLSMTKDEESKNIMLEEGAIRLAIHGLIGSSEKERENAAKLLLEFSSEEATCVKIASEKGALVILTSIAGNLEHPTLSNLAEEVLKLMERVDDNVQKLALAGRFEPLLNRLCEGSDEAKVEMASMLGRMTLTNSCKEQIAHRCSEVLVDLLDKPEAILPSLLALHNLSSLDNSAPILVDSAILPALTSILFENRDASAELKELATSIIANIVSSPGHWELASADRENHALPSEFIIFNLLGLLPLASAGCQVSILRILYGIASSPQASESVTVHIKSGDGLKNIVTFLEHPKVEYRIYAFRLTKLLSESLGENLADELKSSDKLTLLKDKILDNQSTDGERSDAAGILSNLPPSENEVSTLLEPHFVKWIVSALGDQHHNSNERTARLTSVMMEGLIGILLHVARSLDQQSLAIIKEIGLMTVFRDQLILTSSSKAKRQAAFGLRYLSEYRRTSVCGESDPQPPHGFCASLIFMCGKASSSPSTCPIHNSPCEEDSQFCLLRRNCIKPLVDILTDEDNGVRVAAVEALATLVLDTCDGFNFKGAIDELERLGVVEAAIRLFVQARPGVLQEKAIWMVERLLRADSIVHRHSLNQPLVRALVEAFKNGNSITKRHAQEALTHLKQISGVDGKTSSHNRGRR